MSTPSFRDRIRPVELVAMALVVAAFVGVVIVIGSREPTLGVIFAGVAFIVTLLVLAMLALVSGPPKHDPADGPVLIPPSRPRRRGDRPE